jgi:hypothetical protein
MVDHTWNEAEGGDDHISGRDLEETLPGCALLAVISNLLQDDVLVEVDAVESVEIKLSEMCFGC